MRTTAMQKNAKAFTLTEMMVVLIIFSVFATFGIANYQKAVLKARERRAILNLKTIHGANEVYRARAGQYLPGAGLNLAAINTGLEINVFDNDLTYSYTRSSTTTYTVTAAWAGTDSFTVGLNQAAVTATNPCCDTAVGTCKIATAVCPF